MSKRALVSGGGGFVGANLVRKLATDGHIVTAIIRPGSDRRRLDGVDVQVVEADVRDRDAVCAVAGRVRPEWVFHLAAHGAYSWQRDRDGIFASNLVGTMHLLDATGDAGAFIHTGSSSEYGVVDHAPSETEALRPNSDYAVAKAAATLYASHVGRCEDRRVVTLRLYSVYGPWEDERRLIPTLVRHALGGTLPPLVAPDTARDFVYVEDVVEAYLLAATATGVEPGDVLNVGSGHQTTIREVVDVARDVFSVDIEPKWGSMPNRDWDTSTWVSDPRRARERLGWKAATSLRDGLRATAECLSRTR